MFATLTKNEGYAHSILVKKVVEIAKHQAVKSCSALQLLDGWLCLNFKKRSCLMLFSWFCVACMYISSHVCITSILDAKDAAEWKCAFLVKKFLDNVPPVSHVRCYLLVGIAETLLLVPFALLSCFRGIERICGYFAGVFDVLVLRLQPHQATY